MAADKNNEMILDQFWTASMQSMDEALVKAAEGVATITDKATDVINEKTSSLVDKTVEKTAENSTKEEIIDTVADKGQANVATSYAAATTVLGSDMQLSDEQKKIIQERINEIALKQEQDIPSDKMKVQINEQQHIKEQQLSA